MNKQPNRRLISFYSKTSYKTNNNGLRFLYIGNTQYMILGIKGDIEVFHFQQTNVFYADIKEHSQKPIKSYELIVNEY